jgi:hypothetical protein
MSQYLPIQRIVAVLILAVSSAGGALAAGDPAEPPKKITVGTEGLFQPGLLLQGQYVFDQTDGIGTTPTAYANQFRVRRAEIIAKGEILPGMFAYQVMLDPAKVREPVNATLTTAAGDTVVVRQLPGAASVFQDFFVTYLSPYADVSLGQFKMPVSWEAYNSTSRMLLPERPLVSSTYGDKRDVGIRVTKTFKLWGYSAGIFNGNLLNASDNNNSKDLALRLEVYPIEGLMLGGVGYASVGERLAATTKDRWEADVRFERGPFLVQSEYIYGHDGGGPGVSGHGFYAAVAYRFMDNIQPVLRAGYLDTNLAVNLDPAVDRGADEALEFTGGVNYYVQKHEAKLQLAFTRIQYDVRAPTNQLILQAQVAF